MCFDKDFPQNSHPITSDKKLTLQYWLSDESHTQLSTEETTNLRSLDVIVEIRLEHVLDIRRVGDDNVRQVGEERRVKNPRFTAVRQRLFEKHVVQPLPVLRHAIQVDNGIEIACDV